MRTLMSTPVASGPAGQCRVSCASSPLPTTITVPLGLLLPGLPLLTRDTIGVM